VTLDQLHRDWQRKRVEIEREMRVLVVDAEANTRKQLDELLFRQRVPARSVPSGERALQLVERERYSVVITSDVLPGMHGLTLARQLRESLPHLDVLLVSRNPSLRIMSQAFELPLLDVWTKPFGNTDALGKQIRDAIALHADRQMREPVLNDLRKLLASMPEADHLRATANLERRLSAFKRHIGPYDRALVVEQDDANLRLFSEHLLLAGLSVETTHDTRAALAHIEKSSEPSERANLLVADCGQGGQFADFVQKVRKLDPQIQLIAVALKPSITSGQTALRQRIAAYVPWPPTSLAKLAERACELLVEGRREHLVDNLFLELYHQVALATGQMEKQKTRSFAGLIGLRQTELPDLKLNDGIGKREPLERVLSDMLEIEIDMQEDDGASSNSDGEDEDSERREHERVAHYQFLRFRTDDTTTATMAYLADLSEGGIFVRTPRFPIPDSKIDVDFHVEHENQRYRVQCEGRVAWIAKEEKDSPHGVGFGVRFVTPPEDVVALLRRVVKHAD
jgi:CheY-like chemotaxis protein/Tfp pilus assembly protein PilZ